MRRRMLAVWIVALLSSCDGPDTSFDPQQIPKEIVILVPRTASLDPYVDSVGHFQHSVQPAPPFQGPFRIPCGLGECVNVNVFLRGITRLGKGAWAAGISCKEKDPDSPIWPFKAKGPLGEVRNIEVCCPHNAPCTLNPPETPGGADWVIGLLPNGRLATDSATLATMCPELLDSAIVYPSGIHERDFTWPEPMP